MRGANPFVPNELGERDSSALGGAISSEQFANQRFSKKEIDEIDVPHFECTVQQRFGQRVSR